MANIKKLQLNGEDIIPITHESAVIDDNGISIADKYQAKEDQNLDTNIKTIIGAINELNVNNVHLGNALGAVEYDDNDNPIINRLDDLEFSLIRLIGNSSGSSDSENTTLRNLLASILQEEGVSVIEEDNMASLIAKVDNEFEKDNNTINELNTNIENTRNTLALVLTDEGVEVTEEDNMNNLITKVDEEFSRKNEEISNLNNQIPSQPNIVRGEIELELGYISICDYHVSNRNLPTTWRSTVINTNLNEVPSEISVYFDYFGYDTQVLMTSTDYYSSIYNYEYVYNNYICLQCYISDITENSFTLYYRGYDTSGLEIQTSTMKPVYWLATVSGEGNNTGSSGTGGGLDIISATELPATGNENQICVITDNPVNDFVVTPNYADKNTNTDGITLYIGNTSSMNTSLGAAYSTQNNGITINYYFNRVCQGEARLGSYIYQNSQWSTLTVPSVVLIENGVYHNTDSLGIFYTGGSASYGEGTGLTLMPSRNADANSRSIGITTQVKIDFSGINTIKIKACTLFATATTTYLTLCACKNSKYYTQSADSYVLNNNGLLSVHKTATTPLTKEDSLSNYTTHEHVFDVSSWSDENYLGIVTSCTDYAYVIISDIEFI